MSKPKLSGDGSHLTREEAVNLIISSIALEEIGLSHVVNSEGEKLQFVLGTLEGSKLSDPVSVEDLLELNKSVRTTLDTALKSQMLLGGKLQNVLSTPTMQGEKGDKGAVGTILGSYDSVEKLIAAHPTGSQGDAYLVGGELYVWDTSILAWISVGNLTGPQGLQGIQGPRGLDGAKGEQGDKGEQGIQGKAGTVGTIKGSYVTVEALKAAHPTGGEGDFYLVYPDLYVWDADNDEWFNAGHIAGPQGLQGEQGVRGEQGGRGDTGAVGIILGSFDSYEDLEREHPTANQGDAFLVGGDLYVWNENSLAWEKVGNLSGPQGEQGPMGELQPGEKLFTVSAEGENADIVCGANFGFASESLNLSLENGPLLKIEKPYSAGTLIPYASGEYITVSTGASGLPYRRIIIGRGSSSFLNSSSDTLNTTGVYEHAFPMPVEGKITAMSGYFVLTSNNGVIWNASTTLTAAVYVSKNPSDYIFTPVENASASFSIPFNAEIGTIRQFTVDLNVTLQPNDRIMLVISSVTAPQYVFASTVGGRFSGCLRIE